VRENALVILEEVSHEEGCHQTGHSGVSALAGDRINAEYADARDSGFRSGGWPGAAHKGIEVLSAQHKAKTNYLASHPIAELYADIGDKDHAFEWLNPAYQDRCILVMGLRTDARFDSLRSDPRYAELVRKVGFP